LDIFEIPRNFPPEFSNSREFPPGIFGMVDSHSRWPWLRGCWLEGKWWAKRRCRHDIEETPLFKNWSL